MSMRAWLRRVHGLIDGRRRERELAEELESHLQLHVDDNIRAGMTPEDARRAALLKFGAVEAIKDEYRESATISALENMLQDLRYGARKLGRHRGFTVVTVLTLAIGVGATAAMFGLVDALMLRPPAHVRQPDRVVKIDEVANYPRYVDVAERLRTLDLAGFTRTTVSLGAGADAIPLKAECVTPSYFTVLRTPPVLGRAFAADEDTRGGELTVIIGHALWKRQFGGDATVVGRRVRIAGRDYTIIGIAPTGFKGIGLESVHAWILLARNEQACGVTLETKGFPLSTIARVRDGFTIAQATTDAVVADTHPDTITFRRPDGTLQTKPITGPPRLQSIREARSGRHSSENRLALWLAGGALVLLLIGCANVAGLLSMRAIDRRREIALRLQLGASRSRVFAQLLVENLLIAGMCAFAAVVVAAWIGALLRAFFPLADVDTLLNARSAAILAGFALLAGVISGVIPALQASRADTADYLRTGRSLHEGATARHVLLVAQVALALILIVGAGLFVRSVAKFRRHLTYDLDRVTAASVDLSRAGYRAWEIRMRFDLMLQRVRQLPGVEVAALGTNVVLGDARGGILTGLASSLNNEGDTPYSQVTVSPDYFATLGMRIVRGRTFTAADSSGWAPHAVILDEELAKIVFPNEDPIGQCVIVDTFPSACLEVVGVSEAARRGPLRRFQIDSEFFVPFTHSALEQSLPKTLLIRARSSSGPSATAIAAAIRSAAPDLPYVEIQPLTELAKIETRSWRLGATIFALFGALAVALAVVGLYAALAFAVRQRMPEIGVRIAFGADPGDVARMFVRHGLTVAGIGWLIGAGATLALTRYVRSLLFDVAPGDVPTFAGASAIIVAAVLAGCFVPSIRASRIDPATALRTE
jgi:predicted permease